MSAHPEDQFTYSRGLLAELIPMAVDGPEPPARGLTDGPGGVGDPATGGNTLAMILDVRRVLALSTPACRYAVYAAAIGGEQTPRWAVTELLELLGSTEGPGGGQGDASPRGEGKGSPATSTPPGLTGR